jgi:hypothetical protein
MRIFAKKEEMKIKKIKLHIFTTLVFVILLMTCLDASAKNKPLKIKGVYGIRVKGFWFCKLKIRRNNTYTMKSIQLNCRTNEGPRKIRI